MFSKKSAKSDKSQVPSDKKPVYKRWWFWIIIVVLVGAVGAGMPDPDSDSAPSADNAAVEEDTSSQEGEGSTSWDAASALPGMTLEAAWDEIDQQGYSVSSVKCVTGDDLGVDEASRHCEMAKSWQVLLADQSVFGNTVSLTIASPDDYSQRSQQDDPLDMSAVPTDYQSALKQAINYSCIMSMSRQGIYDQLVSEYGGQFTPEAAQYAIDHLFADWGANALAKATTYSDSMHMSKQGIFDQLTSSYGEKFTAAEAQYAVDNVQADWNANALAKAHDYQETMNMSPEAIRDQLTSAYGEQFTPEEADYAVSNL